MRVGPRDRLSVRSRNSADSPCRTVCRHIRRRRSSVRAPARERPPRATSRITGIDRVSGSAFNSARNSTPSPSGSWTSSTIRSKGALMQGGAAFRQRGSECAIDNRQLRRPFSGPCGPSRLSSITSTLELMRTSVSAWSSAPSWRASPATSASGATTCAAPSAIASRGIPNTIELASSCAIVWPPLRRTASSPRGAVFAHPGEQTGDRPRSAFARDATRTARRPRGGTNGAPEYRSLAGDLGDSQVTVGRGHDYLAAARVAAAVHRRSRLAL